MNDDHYALTVKIRKRTDLEQPTSIEEAVSMVAGLLSNGSFLEVLSVEPWWVAYEEAEGIDWGDDE
jgi:hypothetical protein